MQVLRPGGCFITRQTGCHNMQHISEAFGLASSGDYWEAQRQDRRDEPTTVDAASVAFQGAGGIILARATDDVGSYVLDLAFLLFWLQPVPLPEPFDIVRHEPVVRSLIERYQTPRGIAFNEHRDLLVVQRPQ